VLGLARRSASSIFVAPLAALALIAAVFPALNAGHARRRISPLARDVLM
jgi:hypothetical protein